MPFNNQPRTIKTGSTTVSDPLAQAAKRIAELEAALVAATAKASKPITFGVGPSGGISVYGLGQFPVTLYDAQWERFFANLDDLKAYLSEGRKLGAFAKKGVPFVQPKGLPAKFVAKAKREEESVSAI